MIGEERIHLGGNGGDGVESNITGTVQWFGGGGGGGVNINNGQVLPNGGGTGGLGGGGNGSSFGVPVGGSREGCFCVLVKKLLLSYYQ